MGGKKKGGGGRGGGGPQQPQGQQPQPGPPRQQGPPQQVPPQGGTAAQPAGAWGRGRAGGGQGGAGGGAAGGGQDIGGPPPTFAQRPPGVPPPTFAQRPPGVPPPTFAQRPPGVPPPTFSQPPPGVPPPTFSQPPPAVQAFAQPPSQHGGGGGGRGRGRGGGRGGPGGPPGPSHPPAAGDAGLGAFPSLAISPTPSGSSGSSDRPPSQQSQRGKPPGKPSGKPPSAPDAKSSAVIKRADTKLVHFNIPKRKGVGTEGRKTTVEVNFFPLVIKNLGKPIIHYDVAIDPDKPKFMYRDIMEKFRKDNYPTRYPAFDGKANLYSMGPLPFPNPNGFEREVTVFNREKNEDKTWKVTINIANTLDVNTVANFLAGSEPELPRVTLQALDVALRAALTSRAVVVGRSFFSRPRGEVIELGGGLELWHGFFQSAVLGWKPFLNVDVAHKGFPIEEDILRTWCRCLDLRSPLDQYRPGDVAAFEKYVKGIKVEYMLPGQPSTKRIFKINKLVRSARDQTFKKEEKEMSVEQYFRTEKNLNLKFPTLPLLHVGPPQKTIYVPMEFCYIISGQALNRKLDENQTAAMVRAAATKPFIRAKKIEEALRLADYNNSPTVREFGLSIDTRFQKVPARIMTPPRLAYNGGSVAVREGTWRAGQFFVGSSLKNWAIVNLTRVSPQELSNFARMMMTEGRKLGMDIDDRPNILSVNAWGDRMINELDKVFNNLKRDRVGMVVVVIPGRGDAYGKVKQRAEIHADVLTQCLKDQTFRRMNGMTVGNILQKVNSKLNGLNHSLEAVSRPIVLNEPCMILGADVTHPSPDATSIPSIAAVVASHDPKAVKYNIELRLQPPREEVILDFKEIVKSQLKYFRGKTNQVPNRIVYYRDGVSDGQFQQVLAHELVAIRNACTELSPNYKPQITFLVVQKRHHARFFPKREDEEGRSGNVPAGTIVDSEITHKHEMDFYLVSHTGIQGTSRPTKYHLLWDDSNLSPDELERMTYFLCHLFMRCTRSVSYPTPTYYAHLAAFRGRAYLEGMNINLENLEREQRLINENMKEHSPMFFV